MAQWATELREVYRRVTRAMARARVGKTPTSSGPKSPKRSTTLGLDFDDAVPLGHEDLVPDEGEEIAPPVANERRTRPCPQPRTKTQATLVLGPCRNGRTGMLKGHTAAADGKMATITTMNISELYRNLSGRSMM